MDGSTIPAPEDGQASGRAGAGGKFVGRERELKILRGCARKVAGGEPWLVALEGPAGIGKTALVRQWARALEGFTVLRAVADRSEEDYPYGVLGQLTLRLDPTVLRDFPVLATGPSGAVPPYTVGGEFLLLLGELQRSGPIALVVDDAQWMDRPSMQMLGFVLRRLWADRVLTVLVARPGGFDEVLERLIGREHAIRVVLRGLETHEVAQLALQVSGAELARGLPVRLRQRTEGNPLHLCTLLSELPPEATGGGRVEQLPVPASLRQGIQGQLEHLPDPSRALVEALAVIDREVPLTQLARLPSVDDPIDALGPAVAAGLVIARPGDALCPLRIGHDLQRQVVYDGLTPSRRRELHEQAAGLVDPVTALVHRVAATATFDPKLAAELEQTALAEAAASSYQLAATHLLWAAQLTGNRHDQERRLLAACTQSLRTLRPAWTAQHRGQVESCAAGPLRSCVLGALDMLQGSLATAKRLLEESWDQAQRQPDTAWVAGVAGTYLAMLHRLLGNGEQIVEVSRRVLGYLDPASSDFIRCLTVLGLIWCADPPPEAPAELAHLPAHARDVSDHNLDTLGGRGLLRLVRDEPAAAREDLAWELERERAGATPLAGTAAPALLAMADYLLGDWDEAVAVADQAVATAATREQLWYEGVAHFSAVCVPASRGDWKAAQTHLDALHRLVRNVGSRVDAVYTAMSEAFLAQAQAHHSAMLDALTPLIDHATAHPGGGWRLVGSPYRSWQRRLLVEALIGSGHLDDAEAALERLRQDGEGVDYLRVVIAYLSGRLAEARGNHDQALAFYEHGAAPVTGDDAVLYRGMLEHAYGRLLLATPRSHRDAAHWLTRASNRFAALKAAPFLQRCNKDLDAIGQQPSMKGAESPLTERESAVASRVARGLTNQEAARELFVSPKTVEYHLAHVFTKLNITSRRQLASLQKAAYDLGHESG